MEYITYRYARMCRVDVSQNLSRRKYDEQDRIRRSYCKRSWLSKTDAAKAVKAFTDVVVKAMKEGDKVQLVGFGTFEVTKRPERQGINPATKEKITIAAANVPKFKAGAALKKELN